MNNNLICIGIDVAKSHLDICIVTQEKSSEATHRRIANTSEAIEAFFRDMVLDEPLLVCLENTGRYTNAFISAYLSGALPDGSRVYVVDARLLRQSHSSTLQRGKTDKPDAHRIAHYIARHHSELEPWQPKSASVEQLQLLQTERRRLVKQKRQTETASHELELMPVSQARALGQKINRELLKTITEHIKQIDRLIQRSITDDDNLRHTSTLLQSITGVGPVLASGAYRQN